jgi:glycosyltransferase involved in cell wall biosynthesis
LRRYLADANCNVIAVGGSLRVQAYAHAAGAALADRPPLVQFMTERDSAERRSGAFLLSRFGAIVALGSEAARAYGEAAPNTQVIKVNNFLLPDELTRRPPPRADVDGPPVVGVLARLIPEKGITQLLDELATARQAWTKLLIGGSADDPQYLRVIEQRVSSLGIADTVSLLGHVDDLSAFMAAVGVIVVPSVGREGQPTVILDALSHDRPVIVREHVWSTDFAGLPVIPYRDASDLARLLATVPKLPVDLEELPSRFGAQQVLDAFEAAADGIRGRRRPRRDSCTSG